MLFLLFLLLVPGQCDLPDVHETVPNPNSPGFSWQRMSGVGDIAVDCNNPSLPNCRYAHNVLPWVNNSVIVFGGAAEQFGAGTQSFNDVWRWVPATGTWEVLFNSNCPIDDPRSSVLPWCREYAAAEIIGDFLWIMGGGGATPNGLVPLNDTWTFDLINRVWTRIGVQQHIANSNVYGVYGVASATDGQNIYFFGGSGFCTGTCQIYIAEPLTGLTFNSTLPSNDYPSSALSVYDTLNRRWTSLWAPLTPSGPPYTCYYNGLSENAPPAPRCTYWATLDWYQNVLYIVGGYWMTTPSSPFANNFLRAPTNAVYRFIPDGMGSGTWKELFPHDCSAAARPKCRLGHASVFWAPFGQTYPNILIFGGLGNVGGPNSNFQAFNDLWQLQLDTIDPVWKNFSSTQCGNPGMQCSFWHAAVSVSDTLIVFGGQNFQPGSVIALNELWGYRKIPVISPPSSIGSFPTVGGSKLSIEGNGFGYDKTKVRVGVNGNECTNLDLRSAPNSQYQLTCTLPPGVGNGALVSIYLLSPGNWSSEPLHVFNYFPPTVTAVSPNIVTRDQETVITLTGSGFGSNASLVTLHFGPYYCEDLMIKSDSELVCTFPPIPDSKRLDLHLNVGNQTTQLYGSLYIQPDPVPASTTILGYVFFAISIFILVLYAALTYHYRDTRLIIAASIPFLSIILLGGFIMSGIFLILHIADQTHGAECNATVWLALIGFTIIYMSILVKNVRIIYLFSSNARRRPSINIETLFLILFLVLIFDIVFLLVFTTSNQQCDQWQRPGTIVGAVGICAVIVTITIAGVMASIQSRIISPEWPELNERHQLGYSFYTMAMAVLFLALAQAVISTDQLRSIYVIRCIVLFMVCPAGISMIFLPKFIRLLQYGDVPAEEERDEIHNYAPPPDERKEKPREGTEADLEMDDTPRNDDLSPSPQAGQADMAPPTTAEKPDEVEGLMTTEGRTEGRTDDLP